jgi:hypothetical protein
LSQFVSELEHGLADDRDPWTALVDFLRRAVDADSNTLTLALAGKFTPSPELYALIRLNDDVVTTLRVQLGPGRGQVCRSPSSTPRSMPMARRLLGSSMRDFSGVRKR